ncbi:MAG: ATP-binding cassette domain-containing protein [Dehalococcoidales bacterium]|nr:ATP-binding cassette domain-containing protein [Dehalococcoidales bacterium]
MLQLKNVSKEFGTGTIDEVRALDGINIDIQSGDFITVIGSNGAGKSTLLNLIAGVFPPDKGGTILINGKDISHLSEHRRARYFGRVYQDPHVGTAANMTIGENMSLAALRGASRGLKTAASKKNLSQYKELLATLHLGLEDRMSAMVGTLSGGQRQALALVMATISKPDLLLLDEHIAKLDPNTAGIVLSLTESIIGREKMTALMVTHNMEHALRYGNRLLMMHKGQIIVDLDTEKRKGTTVNDLLSAFEHSSGEQLADDSILLSTAVEDVSPKL